MARHPSHKPIDIKSSPSGAASFLSPSVGLLVKLGSIVVHADEYWSPHGHPFDMDAAKTLLADPDVVAWIAAGSAAAMLPKKRN